MKFEEFYQERCAFWRPIDVGHVARRWDRALALLQAKAVEPVEGGYTVASQTQNGVAYSVTFQGNGQPSCTCPDATKETATSAPWGWCKHALATLLYTRNGKAQHQEPPEPPDPAELADPQEKPPTAPYRAVRCPLAGHNAPKQGNYGLYCPTRLNDGSWCRWTDSPKKQAAA